MIEINDKKQCCGCGACAQICGKKCIAMEEDDEGFLYPVVDINKCVGCGSCERVCPMKKHPAEQKSVITAFAASAINEDLRDASSSGGIFSLLAGRILEEEGVVFGAAFDDDFMVQHVMVECEELLPKLRGSKYLQSRTEKTFCEAEEILKKGRKVLYVGTGCQIAGLKNYLSKEYDNLYTVDILCHGTPSPVVWRRYMQNMEKQYDAKIINVSFRKKVLGWKNYSIELRFENGEVYSRVFTEDQYMNFFLSDICLRPSCYKCQYKLIPRASDFTLGDAWGIGKWMPDMDDDRGTSVVAINSIKGQILWNKIEPQVRMQCADINHLVPSNSDARKSVRAHPGRSRFFSSIENGASLGELEKIVQRGFGQKVIAKIKKQIKIVLRIKR